MPPALPPVITTTLLHLSRTGETTPLLQNLHSLAETQNTTPSTILETVLAPESGNSLFHMASANGHTETIEALIGVCSPGSREAMVNRGNDAGNTALHWAALNGHLGAVKALVGAGAEGERRNGVGRRAAEEAEEAGWVEVGEWLRAREGEEVGLGEEEDEGEEVQDLDGTESAGMERAMGDLDVGKS